MEYGTVAPVVGEVGCVGQGDEDLGVEEDGGLRYGEAPEVKKDGSVGNDLGALEVVEDGCVGWGDGVLVLTEDECV